MSETWIRRTLCVAGARNVIGGASAFCAILVLYLRSLLRHNQIDLLLHGGK